MAIDEATRHHLHTQAARSMDERAADGLMEMLPPVGWADVATKHDLAQLEQRIDLRFERQFAELRAELHSCLNAQTKTLFFGLITVMTGIVAAAVAFAH